MIKVKKSSLFGVVKHMMKTGMLICIIFVGMSIGGMFVDYKKTNDGNFIDFMFHKEEAEWMSYEQPPSWFVEKTRLYNNTVRIVWFSLFFYAMFEIFSYFEKPDKHWFRYMKKRLDKIKVDKDD